MGRKKRKQRLSSGSGSETSFTQTPTKKQSTGSILGYFSKINETIESESINMESQNTEIESVDACSTTSNLDIESMSDRDMLKLIISDIRDIKSSL